MLHKVGLLSRGNEELIPFAWDMYHDPETQKTGESNKFLETFSREVTIDFLGLWDSVSSVGWALPLFGSQSLPFTAHNPSVGHIQHAVALDERRSYFLQNLWNPNLEPNQTLEEVWFPGVHCDIGGGYAEAEAGLSKITLRWMMRAAHTAGLRFNPAKVQQALPPVDTADTSAPDPSATKHESLTGFWWIPEFIPKQSKVAEKQFARQWFVHKGRHRHVLPNAKMHVSVLQRRKLLPSYNPPNVLDPFQTVDEGDPAPSGLATPADSTGANTTASATSA